MSTAEHRAAAVARRYAEQLARERASLLEEDRERARAQEEAAAEAAAKEEAKEEPKVEAKVETKVEAAGRGGASVDVAAEEESNGTAEADVAAAGEEEKVAGGRVGAPGGATEVGSASGAGGAAVADDKEGAAAGGDVSGGVFQFDTSATRRRGTSGGGEEEEDGEWTDALEALVLRQVGRPPRDCRVPPSFRPPLRLAAAPSPVEWSSGPWPAHAMPLQAVRPVETRRSLLRQMTAAFDNYQSSEVEAMLSALVTAASGEGVDPASAADAERSLRKLAIISRQIEAVARSVAGGNAVEPEYAFDEARALRSQLRMWGKDAERYLRAKGAADPWLSWLEGLRDGL